MKIFINLLTIFRLASAPFIFLLLTYFNMYLLALVLFIFSSMTDYFDGYLARKYQLTSDFGEILDPVADKVMVLFLLIAISIELSSLYAGFMSSIIISREILVSAIRDHNSRKGNESATKVTNIAKIKTAIQFLQYLYIYSQFICI